MAAGWAGICLRGDGGGIGSIFGMTLLANTGQESQAASTPTGVMFQTQANRKGFIAFAVSGTFNNS